MVIIRNLLVIVLWLTRTVNASEKAYDMEIDCENSTSMDETTKNIADQKVQLIDELGQMEKKLKGFNGNIGIIGGSPAYAGAAYFTAMTALKLGIDDVKIFCNEDTAPILKRFSPDLSVFATLDNIGVTIGYLEKVDVIIIGGGLDHTVKNVGTVIPKVIEFCKQKNKHLIIDLDERFLTASFVQMLSKFPESGVILTPNHEEFAKLYDLLKKPKTSPEKIELDEARFGPNIYILRKGCSNRGISMNKEASWVATDVAGLKRSYGQGHMLSGAVAAFYFYASKHVDIMTVSIKGPMYLAGVATYAASVFINKCSLLAYQQKEKSMITSDMIDEIFATYNDF